MHTGRRWPHIAAALGVFALAFLYLVFLSGYWFTWFGAWGLLFSELCFLALAVGAALACRDDLRLVFPLGRPTLRGCGGALLLWVGGYPLLMVMAAALLTLFPHQMAETVGGVQGIGQALPLWARFLLMAAAPAVCEEALMRGFVQYRFGVLRSRWLRIVIVGMLFGVLHVDLRFPVAAMTGMLLCYAREESGSLIYPMLIHAVNNALSVLVSAGSGAVPAADTAALESSFGDIGLAAVGAYLMLALVSPWLLWAGSTLLRPRGKPGAVPNRTVALCCALASAFCAVAGGVLVFAGAAQSLAALP